MSKNVYVGLDNDDFGGMTQIGNIIKDAWLFDIIPESETCENWSHGQLQAINEKVEAEWDKYGCLVSNLPEDLRRRHQEINNRAIEKARSLGWEPKPEAD